MYPRYVSNLHCIMSPLDESPHLLNPNIRPGPPPYTDFSIFILLLVNSSFAPVLISTATRGHCPTTWHQYALYCNKLLSFLTYMVVSWSTVMDKLNIVHFIRHGGTKRSFSWHNTRCDNICQYLKRGSHRVMTGIITWNQYLERSHLLTNDCFGFFFFVIFSQLMFLGINCQTRIASKFLGLNSTTCYALIHQMGGKNEIVALFKHKLYKFNQCLQCKYIWNNYPCWLWFLS